jgi:hypothetical protein
VYDERSASEHSIFSNRAEKAYPYQTDYASDKEGRRNGNVGMPTFPQNHRPRQVLNGLFNNVIKYPHQRDSLLLAESFALQSLHHLEGIKSMISAQRATCMEGSARRPKYSNIYAIMPYGRQISRIDTARRGIC